MSPREALDWEDICSAYRSRIDRAVSMLLFPAWIIGFFLTALPLAWLDLNETLWKILLAVAWIPPLLFAHMTVDWLKSWIFRDLPIPNAPFLKRGDA